MDITIPVDWSRVTDLIVNGIEGGGSRYWLLDFVLEIGHPQESPWYSDPKLWEGAFRIKCQWIDGKKEITSKDMEKALQLFPKHPHHLADWLQENDDATTADVFLQLLILGEVIYG